MAHSETAASGAGEGSGLRRAREVLTRAWYSYWNARAKRATVLVLNALDDRTLKDIGIDRSEIESIARRHDASDRRITMCARSRS